jgi:hypothetical protein
LLVVNLQQGGIRTLVELDTCHCEIGRNVYDYCDSEAQEKNKKMEVSISSVGRWEQRKHEKKRMKEDAASSTGRRSKWRSFYKWERTDLDIKTKKIKDKKKPFLLASGNQI